MPTTIDLKNEFKFLYQPSAKKPGVVEVPSFNYLMIDGAGDPNTSFAYREAVAALYALAYGLRAAIKKSHDLSYVVMPLQGLWWVEDMRQFSVDDKSNWQWTMMILQPDPVDAKLVATVGVEVAAKKDPPGLDRVRLERYDEGLAVQVMHRGPYAAEAPTIARLHDFAAEQGFELAGKHHEIYLSDPRRVAPERLKTIIRQPVRKAT